MRGAWGIASLILILFGIYFVWLKWVRKVI